MDKVDYQDYMRSPQWKRKRHQVLVYWNNRCGMCYSEGKLQVHHRTYERLGRELITDLIPLCTACHETFHDRTRAGMETIQETLGRMTAYAGG